MQQLRDRFGTNSLIGILLLVMLFSFAGDETFRLVARQIPGADEATPCRWLPSPPDLANNQSLIGRAAIQSRDPIQLRVRSNALPNTPEAIFVIRIEVINNSLGTVPFIYDPNTVIVGDNNTSGLGIIFNPPANILTPGINTRTDTQTYPESRVRILGPQQRCIHKMEFSFNEIPGTLRTPGATVEAYYRGNNIGIVPPAVPTPIYPDQGLWTGVVRSAPYAIPASTQ